MNYELWAETYKPKKNHLNRDHETDMFETYGIELGYVLGIADTEPDRVWTLVDGDDGTYIIDGYHLVNRLGYFISEVPYTGDGIEVLDHLFSEEEDEIHPSFDPVLKNEV